LIKRDLTVVSCAPLLQRRAVAMAQAVCIELMRDPNAMLSLYSFFK